MTEMKWKCGGGTMRDFRHAAIEAIL